VVDLPAGRGEDREVIEIVFYGRGGQGSVTAVQILAKAAFLEGHYTQAFPKFGIERRGAPVSAFCRINDGPIHTRASIEHPDYAIVGDMMAVQPAALFVPMKANARIIFNTTKSADDLGRYAERWGRKDVRLFTLNATEISRRVYGETSIPMTSVAMLGAFCAASHLVGTDSVARALDEFFAPGVIQKNIEAVRAAYEAMREG
jgi:2-oxoacid:acceptor oxidoreductase gamma subunit (pyruvate/2-ketoisovalerate family)